MCARGRLPLGSRRISCSSLSLSPFLSLPATFFQLVETLVQVADVLPLSFSSPAAAAAAASASRAAAGAFAAVTNLFSSSSFCSAPAPASGSCGAGAICGGGGIGGAAAGLSATLPWMQPLVKLLVRHTHLAGSSSGSSRRRGENAFVAWASSSSSFPLLSSSASSSGGGDFVCAAAATAAPTALAFASAPAQAAGIASALRVGQRVYGIGALSFEPPSLLLPNRSTGRLAFASSSSPSFSSSYASSSAKFLDWKSGEHARAQLWIDVNNLSVTHPELFPAPSSNSQRIVSVGSHRSDTHFDAFSSPFAPHLRVLSPSPPPFIYQQQQHQQQQQMWQRHHLEMMTARTYAHIPAHGFFQGMNAQQLLQMHAHDPSDPEALMRQALDTWSDTLRILHSFGSSSSSYVSPSSRGDEAEACGGAGAGADQEREACVVVPRSCFLKLKLVLLLSLCSNTGEDGCAGYAAEGSHLGAWKNLPIFGLTVEIACFPQPRLPFDIFPLVVWAISTDRCTFGEMCFSPAQRSGLLKVFQVPRIVSPRVGLTFPFLHAYDE